MSSSNNFKLGFLGLGNYGFALIQGLLESGQHKVGNLFFEEIDEQSFLDDPLKLNQLRKNYSEIECQLNKNSINETPIFDISSHFCNYNQIIDLIAGNESDVGVLFMTLNRARADFIFEKIRTTIHRVKGTLWIFSAVAKMDIGEIKSAIDIDNVKLVRFLANRSTSLGSGLIAAYCEPSIRDEADVVISRVFRQLGIVRMVKQEAEIDAARSIYGASLGIVAWMAKSLSQSLLQLNQEDLIYDEADSNEIVYNLFFGAMQLFQKEANSNWDNLLNMVAHPKELNARLGPTRFIISKIDQELNSMNGITSIESPFQTALTSAYVECLKEYNMRELEE